MENQKLVDELLAKFNSKIETATKDLLTADELTRVKADFETSVKAMTSDQFKAYTAEIDNLKGQLSEVTEASKNIKEIVKNQAETIDSLKAPQVDEVHKKLNRVDAFKALIVNGFKSESFKKFMNDGFLGNTTKMMLETENNNVQLVDKTTKAVLVEKAVIPVASNHTGSVMISELSDVIRDDAPVRKQHVRDLMNVGMTDKLQIVAGQPYSYSDALTLGAVVLSENGTPPESVFSSKENTWSVKRIANSMRISKRYFSNGIDWVTNYVLANLIDGTLVQEDKQLLYGDGLGDNVKGLAVDAQAFDLTPNTYVAGNIASVATYNGGTQTLVTFAIAHNMRNGDSLTIAGATEASYNTTHTSVIVNSEFSVIIDLAYVAEATALWTGSSKNSFYLGIDNAQEYDVLAVSEALLTVDNFEPTGHITSPLDVTRLGLLKDTTGNYLNVNKGESLSMLPIVGTSAIPAGRFISGNFGRTGVELLQKTPLSIQFIADTTTAKNNEIFVLVEEEIIFPVYNPYAFISGKFATAKTQLELP